MLCLMLTACSEHEAVENSSSDGKTAVKLFIVNNDMTTMTRSYKDNPKEMSTIVSYWLLFYKNDGNGNYTLTNREKHTIGATEQQIEDGIALDAGTYHGYVVANIDDNLVPAAGTAESVLWDVQLTWDNDQNDLNKNRQMFGFFQKMDDSPEEMNATNINNSIDDEVRLEGLYNVVPTEHKAKDIVIEEGLLQANLTAKLYRACALVSLHFDTWNLDPTVSLNVKKVTLHNIPKTSKLWSESKAETNDTYTDVVSTIKFEPNSSGGEDRKVSRFIRNDGNYMNTDNIHTLKRYFYLPENRQGVASISGNLEDKTAGEGKAMPYATYIEVVADHIVKSVNGDTRTKEITYRYALGEDSYGSNGKIEYKNYNVTRNRHYNVYLTLKGYGLNNASESMWKTQLNDFSTNATNGYAPVVEITSEYIRLVDYKGDTYSSSSWSVTNNNEWLHISKTKLRSDFTGKDFANSISGTNEPVMFYIYNKNSDRTTVEGSITITYDDGKSEEITLKRFFPYKFNFGGWTSPVAFLNPAGSTEEADRGEVYHNVFPCLSNWTKEQKTALQLFVAGWENKEVNDANKNAINSLINNIQFRWPAEFRATDTPKANLKDDNTKYDGTVTFSFIREARYNGYYSFEIYSNGYTPTKVNVLIHAPLKIDNVKQWATFSESQLSVSNDGSFTATSLSADGNSFNNAGDNKYEDITVNSTEYKYFLHNKSGDTYFDFETTGKNQTINIVARGRYESNKIGVFKVNNDGTEGEKVHEFVVSYKNNVRNYSVPLSQAGKYRIRKTSGEIYYYYFAVN